MVPEWNIVGFSHGVAEVYDALVFLGLLEVLASWPMNFADLSAIWVGL